MADYSKRETIDVIEELKRIAAEKYPDKDWNGLDENSMTGLLALLVGELSDQLSFIYDYRTKQAYINESVLERDARNVALNLGFIPTYRSGAVSTLEFTNSAGVDVIIPKGTNVTGNHDITFSTVEEITINPSTSETVEGIQGEYKTLEVNAIGDEYETVEVPYNDVININNTTYFRVTVNDTQYTYQESFKDSVSTDLHYIVRYNSDNNPVITFGNGTFGRRLNPSDLIEVEYFTGGGILGNSVKANTLTILRSTFTNSTSITVTNNDNAVGGQNNPSILEIRNTLPGYVSSASGITNINNVSPILAQNYSYVQDAKGMPLYDQTNKKPTVKVYVLPVSDSVIDLTSPQKIELDAFLAENALIGSSWQSESVFEQPMYVELDVYLQNKNDLELKEREIRDYILDTEEGIWRQELLTLDRLPTLKEFTDIATSSISGISNIVRVDVANLYKYPTIEELGGTAADIRVIELTEEVEDGEYILETTAASADVPINFYKPFIPNKISKTFITDERADFELDNETDFQITESASSLVVSDRTSTVDLIFTSLSSGTEGDSINIIINAAAGSPIITRSGRGIPGDPYIFTITPLTGSSSNDDIVTLFNNHSLTADICQASSAPDSANDDLYTLASTPLTSASGSYIKLVDTGTDYVALKTENKIWKVDQFKVSTDWKTQSLVRITYNDNSGANPELKTFFLEVFENTEDTLYCYATPKNTVDTFPSTLNSDDITNINYSIFRSFIGEDLVFGYDEDTNTWNYTATVEYNDDNTLYFSTGTNLIEELTPNVPCYIQFADTQANMASTFWISKNGSVELRFNNSSAATTGYLKIRVSDKKIISFKDFKEVLSLSDDNLHINLKV